MKSHLVPLAVMFLFSLSGCLNSQTAAPSPGKAKATGKALLKVVTKVDCALFLEHSGVVKLTVKNIGTRTYTGSALVYVDINGNRKTSPVYAPIRAGGSVDVSVERPNIAAGDWTGGVGIDNQRATTASCIG